jgi:DNA-binding NarL/FixJ family response regulator
VELTKREHEIVALLLRGQSNKEIARALNISHGTVKIHIYNIFSKTGHSNRAKLVAAIISASLGS